jgi:hypothetical protein
MIPKHGLVFFVVASLAKNENYLNSPIFHHFGINQKMIMKGADGNIAKIFLNSNNSRKQL